MKYNFDEIIDRNHTAAIKWEGLKEVWGQTNLIPVWVADMDFTTAPFVLEAILCGQGTFVERWRNVWKGRRGLYAFECRMPTKRIGTSHEAIG